jgi:hypothetical protein
MIKRSEINEWLHDLKWDDVVVSPKKKKGALLGVHSVLGF